MPDAALPTLADVILRLVDVFQRLDAPYAIGGAVAASFWGVPRTTQDADCLVAVPALAYQRLADELTAREFRVETGGTAEVPRVDVLRRQVETDAFMSLSCRHTSVELFVPVVPLQNEILRRAVEKTFYDRLVKVTTAEDLVLLKMAFHRQKDLLDVRGILHVQRGRLDLAYLRDWSARMLDASASTELERLIESQPTG